jgi:hypothetical protein
VCSVVVSRIERGVVFDISLQSWYGLRIHLEHPRLIWQKNDTATLIDHVLYWGSMTAILSAERTPSSSYFIFLDYMVTSVLKLWVSWFGSHIKGTVGCCIRDNGREYYHYGWGQ